jgi:ketosteroid isomerase-like protein
MSNGPGPRPGKNALARDVYVYGQSLLEYGDSRGWADMFAVDGVFEGPCAPPDAPFLRRIEGRERIYRILVGAQQAAGELFENSLSFFEFHETTDPEVIITEFEVVRKDPASGISYTMPYVHRVTVRNGEYVLFRDYTSFQLAPPATTKMLRVMAEVAAELDSLSLASDRKVDVSLG